MYFWLTFCLDTYIIISHKMFFLWWVMWTWSLSLVGCDLFGIIWYNVWIQTVIPYSANSGLLQCVNQATLRVHYNISDCFKKRNRTMHTFFLLPYWIQKQIFFLLPRITNFSSVGYRYCRVSRTEIRYLDMITSIF